MSEPVNITTGLIVPVDIAALCVGTIDQSDNQHGTSTFSGATTFYTKQSGTNNAFVGVNVVLPFSAGPWQQLTQGIHLHWALPEVFTKGAQKTENANISFQQAPNRWLVSRFVIDGSNVKRSTWIVQSDTLNAKMPEGQLAISLPVKKVKDTDQDFMYAGFNQAFTGDWVDPGDHSRFMDLTGQPLSAVASGDASFASYYPNSRSLFGFFDAMTDVKPPVGKDVNIMYQLTGWFSDPKADPLYGGKSRQQLNTLFGWTFAGDDATADHTLYNGIIQGIRWNADNKYIVDQPDQKPIDAVVSIGNNPAETFSAYFRDRLHPGIEYFEKMLNALQNGLLTDFATPEPDQLAAMEEALQQQTFASFDSGTIYEVVRQEKDQPEEHDLDLPLPLEESLNSLNLFQQEVDFYGAYIGRYQWQLFADWYKLVNTTDSDIRNTLHGLLYNNVSVVWPDMQQLYKKLTDELQGQLAAVNAQLIAYDATLLLKPTAAARYWQPNEPVVTMISDALQKNLRHANIRESYNEGYVFCRLIDQVITAIQVAGQTIDNSKYSGASLPAPNHLPYPVVSDRLLLESILLNTSIISSITGIAQGTLETALKTAMQGHPQDVYTFTGTPPSLLSTNWWTKNPWYPLFAEWTAQYYPLENTEVNNTLQDYSPTLFNDNYSIDQNAGGALNYVGPLDPKKINFTNSQNYKGSALISTSSALAFRRQLEDYLARHEDGTLEEIVEELKHGVFATQALNGFNGLLLQQQQSMQLNIKVTKQNPYWSITEAVGQLAKGANKVSPVPNGYYNPIRAGYMQFSLRTIDMYGQKRDINITKTVCSDALTTWYNKTIENGIVYMPARIAQPASLVFRWLAGVGDEIQEMNSHPATTPVCGWLLPNHLNGSLMIYNAQGHAMGTLFLNGNETAVMWQSAPGDNLTINQPVQTVLALQNPHLRDLAIALQDNGPDFFKKFWKAVDEVHNFIDPHNYAQSSDLAVLIGRPIALTEAMLRLEVAGGPSLNQSWATITSKKFRTDNAFTKVQFPVILGDLEQINDGLIGYFLKGDSTYNFKTFFTEGAAKTGQSGVVKPAPTTITLTPSPSADSVDPSDQQANAKFVLMLMDPRASVHASTGILPTKEIDIPADMYADTLGILEMTFLTSPVLMGATGLDLPLPQEDNYQWSWVEETVIATEPRWMVLPDIVSTGGQAIADYTPQTIREGWLRLNPQLLRFVLLNPEGQPVAAADTINTLTMKLTNRRPAPITFKPGQLIEEGFPTNGSVIYVHFGKLMKNDEVPNIQPAADNWQFKLLNDQRYGFYWAMTPVSEVKVAPDHHVSVTLNNLKASNVTGQVQLYFDYYGITGINDGVDSTIITLVSPQ